MKKIILTLLVTISSVAVYAQWGITGGLNMSKYSYSNSISRKSLFSFNAGLLYRANLTKEFKWQPELLFSQKGARSYRINTGIGVFNYSNKLNYIQLSSPFIYNTIVEKSDVVSFDFGAGPYVAYLLSGTNISKQPTLPRIRRALAIGNDIGDEFKSIDAGVMFLAGIFIKRHYSVNFKYDLGLRNLEPTYPTKLKTGNFAINFIYFFK